MADKDLFSFTEEAPARAGNLPTAPAVDALDEDDGIFMSWPGGDESDAFLADPANAEDAAFTAPQDENADIDEDEPPRKKKKTKKAKKSAHRTDADAEDDDAAAQYAFRRAAKSDIEESSGKHKKEKKKKDETDNEATLSSLKYYKYTRKLKHLMVHRIVPIALSLLLIVGFVLYFFRLQHLNFVNLSGYPAEEVFAATGIKKNDFVFSVSSSDIEKKLRTKFPYIQSVSVELSLPDTVSLLFEEDCALFYTQIYDEYFVISESMRVLGRYDNVEDMDPGLRAVTLPSVSWAVVGHDLRFFDASYITFLRTFITEMENADIYDSITSMDISNRFDIVITYEDRLEIFLGDDTYLASNLSFVKSIVEKLDDDERGEINIIDNKTASFSAKTEE